MIYTAIVVLPLLGALIAGLFGRIIGLGFRRETPRHLSNETCPPE